MFINYNVGYENAFNFFFPLIKKHFALLEWRISHLTSLPFGLG